MTDRPRRPAEAFGAYQLHGKIAAGGMASVFLAQRTEGGDPDEWLAVKRVHPHLTNREDVRQMFLNEAKLLSQLDHPNICGILDYGIEGESPFLVMRYLHGAPLSGLIRKTLDLERQLPVDLMAYIAACICDGLHYAHEAEGDAGPLGLVHRDISPQNIFVTFSGAVQLLDFGVAKAAGFQGMTRTGHIKGKYAYMSPEQAEARTLDRRSDVFALGTVLWESLTGRHLFKRKREVDTLRAIAKGRAPKVSELNAAVPASLDQIVAKALVADVNHRYQTAAEMGMALWSYLTTTAVPMGSDEVTEIMIETFPDAPKAGELWPNATEFDVPALTLPPEDLEELDGTQEAPAGQVPTLDDPEEDIFAEQTRRVDDNETMGMDVAVIPPDEFDEVTAQVDNLAGLAQDALAQPTMQDVPIGGLEQQLMPWRQPVLERPTEMADTSADDNTDEQDIPSGPRIVAIHPDLKERPALVPHPFDASSSGTLEPDVPDTLVTAGLTPQHQIVTSVPQEEISENPPEHGAGTLEVPAPLPNAPIGPMVTQNSPTIDPGDTAGEEEEDRRHIPILVISLLCVAVGTAIIAFFWSQA